MNRYIFITTQFEGYHRYKDAPDEVDYLRFTHRHIFGVKVKVTVSHNDRDIEFILFKHQVNGICKQFEGDNNALSCEMMANKIYKGELKK